MVAWKFQSISEEMFSCDMDHVCLLEQLLLNLNPICESLVFFPHVLYICSLSFCESDYLTLLFMSATICQFVYYHLFCGVNV